jgi:hypothetical protein
MLDHRRKLLPVLAMVLLTGLPAILHPPRAAAQQKPQGEASSSGEASEVATRFSGILRLKNAKGAAVPLKVEVKQWTVTGSTRPFEMPDLGFCIVHLISGLITTDIAGKTTARHTGDFWVLEKGQRMAISMKRPQESVGLQTIAVSTGH